MKNAVLCFLIKDQEICLGMKKVRFGAGKYNGFGGKVGDKEEFKNETLEEAVVREGKEEFNIKVHSVEKAAEIDFRFPHQSEWDQTVHVYLCKNWKGEPQESEEIKPEWFSIKSIPYNRMWSDDQYWLPQVLQGNKIKAEFEFTPEEKIAKQHIKVIDGFGDIDV